MSLSYMYFAGQLVKVSRINCLSKRISSICRLQDLNVTGSGIPQCFYSSLSEGPAQKKKTKTRRRSKLSTDVIKVSEKEAYESNTKVFRLHPSKIGKSITAIENNIIVNLNETTKIVNKFNNNQQEPICYTGSDIILKNVQVISKNNTSLSKEDINMGKEDGSKSDLNILEIDLLKSALNIKSLVDIDSAKEKKSSVKLKGKKLLKSKEKRKEKSTQFVEKNDANEKKKSSQTDDLAQCFVEMRKNSKVIKEVELLAATISVCVRVGLYQDAFAMFNQYLQNQRYAEESNIEVYNVMLKGIANNKDYSEMEPVIAKLKKSLAKPDFNTFASILCCLGKDVEGNKSAIEDTLQWMESENISLKSVIEKALFMGDSKERAIKSFENFHPEFRESSRDDLEKASVKYKNDLVNCLNKSIFSKKISPPLEGIVSLKDMQHFLEKQSAAEVHGYLEIKNIKRIKEDEEVLESRKELLEWETRWRKSLTEAFLIQRDFYKASFEDKDIKKLELYPYLICLDVKQFVDILITEVNTIGMGSEWFSLPQHSLASNIGRNVFSRFLLKYQMETGLHTKLMEIYEIYFNQYLEGANSGRSYIPRVQFEQVLRKLGTNSVQLFDSPPEWPYAIKKAIGEMLYDMMISCITISMEVKGKSYEFPALYKVQRQYNVNDTIMTNEVKPSPKLVEVFLSANIPILRFPTNTLPMITPPLPWTSPNSGGYLFNRAEFVTAVRFGHLHKAKLDELRNGELFPVMDVLNQLGTMPWKINTSILDLVIEIFNDGGWAELEIPSLSQKFVAPITSNMSFNEKIAVKKSFSDHEKARIENYSKWCNALYKLSIANHFRDNIVWLPQKLDFRGRTYPIPTHLSHLASDLFRSLMIFAKGKPLGKDGLNWLKLHLINLTGIKKRFSIDDRLAFCDEMLDKIMDSADNPKDGEKWWSEADEPWQCLAACIELTAALRSPVPEEYVSFLPIHQDGSCNGLQHYAALGRDKAGAKSVNLSPGIIPQDVYTDVVNLVEKERQKDAAMGEPLALTLEGFIMRKVIKQTVMTTVYGVTRHGAKLQIAKQLKYLDAFPQDKVFSASAYLSKKTFDSLGAMFSSTKNIQEWLVVCADGITKVCMKNVDWITPLGFPVVQSYSKLIDMKTVSKKSVNVLVSEGHKDSEGLLQPLVMKQKNAFPPNFIHSLDSSHMMLTSLYCQAAGISFASVHDCFWTHACTVDTMNKICRKQFVALHSQPILENLSKHFIENFGNIRGASNRPYTFLNAKEKKDKMSTLVEVLTNVPKKGTFNINKVLDSVFFFS